MPYVARPAKCRASRRRPTSDDDIYVEDRVPLPVPVVYEDNQRTGLCDARGVPIWREPEPIGYRFGENDDDDRPS